MWLHQLPKYPHRRAGGLHPFPPFGLIFFKVASLGVEWHLFLAGILKVAVLQEGTCCLPLHHCKSDKQKHFLTNILQDTKNTTTTTTTTTPPPHHHHHHHHNRQTTNNKQQTTNNKQQTTNNKQQTTNNKQQTTPPQPTNNNHNQQNKLAASCRQFIQFFGFLHLLECLRKFSVCELQSLGNR